MWGWILDGSKSERLAAGEVTLTKVAHFAGLSVWTLAQFAADLKEL
ncbi:hypothetical protein [Natrononativus amylolyticus]|nr:hypothetical protein [Natrononativus amylolyticus]